jgi:hypothetical protein
VGISEIQNYELATNSKNKNIRDLNIGVNKFMKCYQWRSNLEKDENGNLFSQIPTIVF